MVSPLVRKLGLRAGVRTYLGDAPGSLASEVLSGSEVASTALRGDFGFMLVFFTSARGLDRRFPQLRRHLAAGGALWIAWPKSSGPGGGQGTDLALPRVIEIGYRHGLVESKTIALDATWSAMKFTAPRPGRVYRNSYGQLTSQA